MTDPLRPPVLPRSLTDGSLLGQPLLDEPPPERSDAARNRESLLCAARRLVEEHGVEAVTMDEVASAAQVGKGTAFRRFGSRAGLMAALLDRSEADFQGRVISGSPPLGPGAAPLERLLAFGRARIELNLTHSALIAAAEGNGTRSYAAYSFSAMHVRYLLTELGVSGDVPLLATALLAPMEVMILRHQVDAEQIDTDRIVAGWVDLVHRVVA